MFVICCAKGVVFLILSKVEKLTYDCALSIVESKGYKIYDIEYIKEGPHWFLRVFIDRDDGVSVDDCEMISKELGTVLDEKDFVQTNYFLEISSPGIERNLRQSEHFESAIGENIKLKLYKAVSDTKEAEGKLVFADDNYIVVDTQKGEIKTEKKNIAKANIIFEF